MSYLQPRKVCVPRVTGFSRWTPATRRGKHRDCTVLRPMAQQLRSRIYQPIQQWSLSCFAAMAGRESDDSDDLQEVTPTGSPSSSIASGDGPSSSARPRASSQRALRGPLPERFRAGANIRSASGGGDGGGGEGGGGGGG